MIFGQPSLALILINLLASPLIVLWGNSTNSAVYYLKRIRNDLFRFTLLLLVCCDFLFDFLSQFWHVIVISAFLLAISAPLLLLSSFFVVLLFLFAEDGIVVTVGRTTLRSWLLFDFFLLLVDVNGLFLLFFLLFFAKLLGLLLLLALLIALLLRLVEIII